MNSIIKSTLKDIPEILRLYVLAREFQKLKFPGNLWPKFDGEFVANEILDNRQFKLLINEKVACIWTITYTDVQIWEERDQNDAIYIHRIATNPDFRGNDFVKILVEWARTFAKEKCKRFIRLDTCGNNERLIAHYQNCGFEFLGIKRLKDSSGLPSHYQNADVCFFEIDLSVQK